MVNYAVFILTVLFATTLCAPPPSVRKRYRSEYEYNERTDAFYKLHTETRSRRNLEKVCEVEGASLMVPETHEDIVQVHAMFKRYPDLGQYLWVATDGRTHESAEEPALINLSSEETNSADDERIMVRPSKIYDPQQGGWVYLNTPIMGKCEVLTRRAEVEEINCFQQLPFVCKVEAKDAPHDSHCDVFANNYQYNATVGSCYSVRSWPATWNEAYSECRQEGAHLVVLNSEDEMAVVRALMQATPRVSGSRNPWYYFAGFRANKPIGNEPAVYRTIFNQTLSEAGYAGWSPGEPNNLKDEYCGTLLSSDGMLNDANCDHLYAFICEKEVQAKP